MLYTETVAGSTLGLLKKNIIKPFKAITYFDDIGFEEDIVMLNGEYDWKLIEKRLVEMAKVQNKIFESFPLPRKSMSIKKNIHKH